ncbi:MULTISPECIES: hypothetical protein [Pseudomonas]|uniref:Uncharacterized protein n=1 Tax=Pseudomonas lutea TaxID=243924 RepID=A0A9X8QLR0_9PSED|nr:MULTISPECIES: hypothetical protein [Pseudomonas]SER36919.1 hypothetical protein SAMN05216409_11873 [Pseudomonas lutea]
MNAMTASHLLESAIQAEGDKCQYLAQAVTDTAIKAGLLEPGAAPGWAQLFFLLNDLGDLVVQLQKQLGIAGNVCPTCNDLRSVLTQYSGIGPCPTCSNK